MAAIIEGGFTEEQLAYMPRCIFDGVELAQKNSKEMVDKASRDLAEIAENIEQQRNAQVQAQRAVVEQMAGEQQRMTSYLTSAAAGYKKFIAQMEEREMKIRETLTQLAQHGEQKEVIIKALDEKQAEIRMFPDDCGISVGIHPTDDHEYGGWMARQY